MERCRFTVRLFEECEKMVVRNKGNNQKITEFFEIDEKIVIDIEKVSLRLKNSEMQHG
jgi:3-dehydroquinate dehydratase